MTCYALHIMEDPDRDAYRDPDLKDVIGLLPRLYCAVCDPLQPLLPSESLHCMDRDAPCWKPPGTICPSGSGTPDLSTSWSPKGP